MRIFLFVLTIGVCLGVLVSGYLHWNNKLHTVAMEAKHEQEKYLNKEQENKQVMIKSLDPSKHTNQPIMDFLLYKALTQEKVVITAYGSNGIAGSGINQQVNSWLDLVENALRSEHPEFHNLKVTKHGYEGYTTTNMINGGKINDVIVEQPDLVLLEAALLSNYNQSISLEQTINDIEGLVNTIQREVPDTKVILLLPNPIINSENRNSLELTYIDYINETIKKINEMKWSYINSHEKILAKITEENIVLADIMSINQFFLNDKGYTLWYEVIFEHLKTNSF